MTEILYVNADWSAIVPAGSPEAAFGIQPKDAKRRGLLPLETGETLGEPEVLLSANDVAPEETPEAPADPEPAAVDAAPEAAEAKEAPAPADKSAAKPANKAARKPATK